MWGVFEMIMIEIILKKIACKKVISVRWDGVVSL